jgi:hypothetical protein
MARFNKELRQATEFIMKQKPYSLSDIDGMGIDVFLDIIDECITSN